MKRFLVFLLSSLALLSVWAQSPCPADSTEGAAVALSGKCAVMIDMGDASLTGIAVTRDDGDVVVGSIVNEFGLSVLDFRYDKAKGKLKLTHLAGFLNKWYVRKVLGEDLKLCVQSIYGFPCKPPKRHAVEWSGASVTVTNTKRHISYTFSPLKLEQDYDTEE